MDRRTKRYLKVLVPIVLAVLFLIGVAVAGLVQPNISPSRLGHARVLDTIESHAAGAIIGAPIGVPSSADSSAPAGGAPQLISDEVWAAVARAEADGFLHGKEVDGLLPLPFRAISDYTYTLPDPEVLGRLSEPDTYLEGRIPDRVRELDGRDVQMVGFMVPIEVDRKGKMIAFALTQNQNFCCYGIPPAMNEIVMVTMRRGRAAKYSFDVPIVVRGQLHVGEAIDDGYVQHIYRIEAESARELRN
jgi:hypothetical protein